MDPVQPQVEYPLLRIVRYRAATKPIMEAVTKFGGQPVFLEQPEWPISANERFPGLGQMHFICQVALDDRVFGPPLANKMAYVFMADTTDRELRDELSDGMTLIEEPGSHAVIIQPGGVVDVATEPLAHGPTLMQTAPTDRRHGSSRSCEFAVDLSLQREARPSEGDKVGGIPFYPQSGFYPESGVDPFSIAREVLQLDSGLDPPYSRPWGEYVLHVVLSADAKRGRITYECG